MVFGRNFLLALNAPGRVDCPFARKLTKVVLRDGEDIKDRCRRFAPGEHYSLGSKAMNLQTRLYLILAVVHMSLEVRFH